MSTAADGPSVPKCLDMDEDNTDYTAAEQRLLDALATGGICDFTDEDDFVDSDPTEMASWGPERTIRATLLRRLLTATGAEAEVRLQGAAIKGVLDLTDMNVLPLELSHCRVDTVEASRATFTGKSQFPGTTFTSDAEFFHATFAGKVGFTNATFNGNAGFFDATFTGRAAFLGTTGEEAGFTHATFAGNASFTNATFTDYAMFDDATFTSALFLATTFTGVAWFKGVTFTRMVVFDGATFTNSAVFEGATFTGPAGFDAATFSQFAKFRDATFTGDADFDRATFTGDADFDSATFTGNADFDSATFTGDATFRRATFTGYAWYDNAIAHTFIFTLAQFHVAGPGPWAARHVWLAAAVFHMRARVAVAAVEVDCGRLQAREGLHLLVRGGAVDLEDAEFLRHSILAHSASEPSVPERSDPGERPEGFDALTLAEQARWTAKEEAFQFAQELADELGSQQVPQTQVVSLRRATAGDLVLSGVGLEDCAFAGAHGLDNLRISATCSFQRPPAWPSRTWRPFTSRRIIAEEAQWRQAHTRGWATAFTTATATPELDDPVPTALEIAGIYRDLRKGLEDAKDEPGAADFYYGEMEMRRLATRGSRHDYDDNGGAKGQRPSWTERRLLDAYWAVSGYGLRAWRAVTALTILLVGCAALFTLPLFAHLPVPPQQVASVNLRTGTIHYAPITQPSGKTGTPAAVQFGTSLKFTSTESLTLIRTSGTPLLETTVAGTVLDIAVRLLAPLLFGLALLAVRGRIKR